MLKEEKRKKRGEKGGKAGGGKGKGRESSHGLVRGGDFDKGPHGPFLSKYPS